MRLDSRDVIHGPRNVKVTKQHNIVQCRCGHLSCAIKMDRISNNRISRDGSGVGVGSGG